jgi:hypothetical protein
MLPPPVHAPVLQGRHYRTRVLPTTSGVRLHAILIAGIGAFSACAAEAIILHDVVAFGAGFVCGLLYLGIVVMVGQRLRDVQPLV